MKTAFLSFLSLLLCLHLLSCRPENRVLENAETEKATALLKKAGEDVKAQHFDAAMENALATLAIADAEDASLLRVQALDCIIGIDIMTSRDADAWEKRWRPRQSRG